MHILPKIEILLREIISLTHKQNRAISMTTEIEQLKKELMEALKEMGIKKMGHRQAIVSAIIGRS